MRSVTINDIHMIDDVFAVIVQTSSSHNCVSSACADSVFCVRNGTMVPARALV